MLIMKSWVPTKGEERKEKQQAQNLQPFVLAYLVCAFVF
jgi:hypothetical protein